MSMWKHDYDTIHIAYNYINSYFIFCFWALCFCICVVTLFLLGLLFPATTLTFNRKRFKVRSQRQSGWPLRPHPASVPRAGP